LPQKVPLRPLKGNLGNIRTYNLILKKREKGKNQSQHDNFFN